MENGESYLDEDLEVSDEEKYSDKKIKKRILNTRELLVHTKNRLETERLVEPEVEYSEFEAFAAWANLVQSYLYELGILLNNEEVPDAEHYRDELELGSIRIIPEDTDGIPFSNIIYDGVDAEDIIHQSSRLQRGCELPEPVTVAFDGLMAVAETDLVIERQWVVTANPQAAVPNQDRITVVGRQPVPEKVFQNALVESDQFLQQAGIGLDLSDSGVPEFGFEEVHEDEQEP